MRAAHIRLVSGQNIKEILKILKQLTAQNGCSNTIYSDNARSFVAQVNQVNQNMAQVNQNIRRDNHFLNRRCQVEIRCKLWRSGGAENSRG